jgi:hypothetical protein
VRDGRDGRPGPADKRAATGARAGAWPASYKAGGEGVRFRDGADPRPAGQTLEDRDVIAEPLTEFVPVARVKDGRAATEELTVTFRPADGPVPAVLTIAGEWRPTKGTFARWAEYRVRPIPSDLPGRAFRLDRDAEAVARDPDGETFYHVLISDEPGGLTCDCKGFAAAQTRGLVCRHVAALNHLIASGAL